MLLGVNVRLDYFIVLEAAKLSQLHNGTSILDRQEA
jgi:hypothetical protein